MMKFFIFGFALLLSTITQAAPLPLDKLNLPAHFSISMYAHVPNAREMALGEKNTIFVGSREAGNVYAVIPNKTPRVITVASGLEDPNGVAFYKGALYVADINHILRFDNIEAHLTNPPKPVIVAKLPNKGGHDWHFIRFGPDNKLYVGIGAPCNICQPDDPRFNTIMRMNPDGSQFEIFANGIRNTVGFDWDPKTQQLWFTDNGRDWLGDESPPDELNVAPHKDMHFGFPFCHGKNISDPSFGKLASCDKFTPPALELPAHVAALGMSFYTGNMFPAVYHNQIFIAEHGSWNRSKKSGYQVINVKVENNKVISVHPFITGWVQNEHAWGRPVATLVMPDGSLLISDDKADVIYQAIYKKT